MSQVINEVSEVVAKLCGVPVAEITPGRAFGYVPVPNEFDPEGKAPPLELDSLDRIQLAVDLENRFDIEISDDEVDSPRLAHVGGLAAFVKGRFEFTHPNRDLRDAVLACSFHYDPPHQRELRG